MRVLMIYMYLCTMEEIIQRAEKRILKNLFGYKDQI